MEKFEAGLARKAENLVKESDPRMAEYRIREIERKRKDLEQAKSAKAKEKALEKIEKEEKNTKTCCSLHSSAKEQDKEKGYDLDFNLE